jgi:hypothetical protein
MSEAIRIIGEFTAASMAAAIGLMVFIEAIDVLVGAMR